MSRSASSVKTETSTLKDRESCFLLVMKFVLIFNRSYTEKLTANFIAFPRLLDQNLTQCARSNPQPNARGINNPALARSLSHPAPNLGYFLQCSIQWSINICWFFLCVGCTWILNETCRQNKSQSNEKIWLLSNKAFYVCFRWRCKYMQRWQL